MNHLQSIPYSLSRTQFFAVTNWVKIKYQDGSQEMIYEIATIKAESEET